MKKTFAMAAMAIAISMGSISCKKKISDADLTTAATTVVSAYSGSSVEVKDGVAHLSGEFASEADKKAAIEALKKITGVKDVMDMASVKAAVIETASAIDPALQQKVTDALKDFPSVKVGVENGELTLTGDVTSSQARKIKESVDALKLGKVNFNYTVK
ncbi:BON domain-containing protein [Elizabethkingia sp. JS20170427COW]|uniref:BON domain-containing protein n=1 Tax=Elizabethkingia sp. JS20170427COW TaxID=2583851 RepID=UPI0011108877|nr:BON domain-containing protein [Elizabethkingia sp. JS20170427COW]QCX53060.1 BON domain-containing protein [Elizabethkingia sp. JS20170427COW]